MIDVIDAQMDNLRALCRTHHVRRLEVFGSATDGTFDPDRSDLDFLVEFLPLSAGEHYEAYFGLWEQLGALFGRKVDLIEPHTMRNPYFIREVNATRKTVYAA
jgi:predicted nucleotidyltransferase